MITFKKFLVEQKPNHEHVVKFAELVKRDCQPFLKASGGAFFLRGLNPNQSRGFTKKLFADSDDNFLIGAVRNDRMPKDSPKWLHDALNQYFIKKTGIPVRSTSLFVSADRGIVEHYGTVYIVFPIGEFHYAWSKHFVDPSHELFLMLADDNAVPDSTSGGRKVIREFMHFMKVKAPQEYAECGGDMQKWIYAQNRSSFTKQNGLWATFVTQFINNNDLWLFDKGLKQIASGGFKEQEVMFVCDKYYAIDASHFHTLATIL